MHKIKADIYFPIGFGFEDTWLEKFANQNKNMKFVDMTKGIKRIMMKKHNHHHGDASNKEYYLNNYNNFLEEIDQTDEKIKAIFSKIEKNSKFMVFHPAWGYFAKDYNLVQFPIEVEGKEPKPKMLKRIIEEAKKENIKAIFTQSEFSDKSAKVIADELKIKVIKDDLALLFLLLNIHNYIHKSLLIQEFFQQFQYLLKQLIF